MLATLIAAAALVAGAGPQPFGVWNTAGMEAQVRLTACGASICGYPVPQESQLTDLHNKDPGMRARPMRAVQILKLDVAANGGWAGWVYSPRNGKMYRATLHMEGTEQLKLTGCLVGPFCQSQVWTRSTDASTLSAGGPS